MKKSRRNVYYDLKESPFVTWYRHMCLSFSSEFNLTRFKDQLHNHITKKTAQYERMLKIEIDHEFNYVAIIDLYRNIEKRGFQIKYKGVDLSCNLSLELEIKTLKNSEKSTDPHSVKRDV